MLVNNIVEDPLSLADLTAAPWKVLTADPKAFQLSTCLPKRYFLEVNIFFFLDSSKQ